ncbi:MAG: DUF3883 domain-containing protein [Caldilineaceae bacterium]|nr:DUF3883 domain-containing protein [Caldilineaceae bacterium]
MSDSKYLSRTTNYLGDLGAKLRDLQGYSTLAHELIQNADDANASLMSFNIMPDALILDNDGVFSDCQCHDNDTPQCPWTHDGKHNHQCDFHRFREHSSGDKRFQEGTTGAFGIGFISVYQLTDSPELISAGRHWILHEEESEGKRIEVCSGCCECCKHSLPGTRFIFPFARDNQSPLRRALKADPVPEDATVRLLRELDRALPAAMLFLKNIGVIEIRESGVLCRKFERVTEGDTIIISQGSSENDRVWRMLHGDFQSEGDSLRRRHYGRIEEKRSSKVMIALPDNKSSNGLLCAFLPTEEAPGLPFHINADFFPSNDRKRIILVDDYQSQWNRTAILAAARTVAAEVPRLTGILGAERFWHLVSTLEVLASNSREDRIDSVWAEFWNELEVALRKEKVVLTSAGGWTTANSGVTILQSREEADNIHVLQRLGIELVSEDLRPYQSSLRKIGVPLFNVEALCSALATNGLNKPIHFDDLPPYLKSDSGRAALWAETRILLQRQGRTPHARKADEERLQAISLAPTIHRELRPCKETFRADAPTTVSLFEPLGLDIPFLDEVEKAFEPLSYLCNEFHAIDAVQVFEMGDTATVQKQWIEGKFSISGLIAWFANRREQIVNNEYTRSRLAELSVFPSGNKLRPLTKLVLPGGFDDQLKLTRIVDMGELSGQREFLKDLDVPELNFRTYVLEYVSQALDDESLDQKVRSLALTLLAERFAEFTRDNEVRQKLSAARLIKCTDGAFRRADECYFQTDIVQEVLGNEANIVELLDDRAVSVRELFRWLGVERVPRLGDIVQAVRKTVAKPCSDTAVARIRRVVNHLGGRFEDCKDNTLLDSLKSVDWLPARGDRRQWYKPGSLYAPYQAHIFDSQAKILHVSPNSNRSFLEFLGVQINPSPALVVEHLLYCAERKQPVNVDVYRFLNENADAPAIQKLKSARCLWIEGAYRSPDHVFWEEHQFPRYRWRLGDNLWSYRPLLERIGVANSPNHEDAMHVLREISSDFASASRPLGDEEYAVLMNCWKMCEKALEQGTLSEQCLGSLGKIRSIPHKGRVLDLPTRLFFDNRVGLAAKFGEYLSKNVIVRPLEAGRAFMAAGVQQLGSAVKLILLRKEDPVPDSELKERLRERRNEIARVLACQMASSDVNSALDRLNTLNCNSATLLVIQYRLDVFRPSAESKPEHVPSLFQPDSHVLWTTYSNGRLPWAPLARELAIALCPEEDPGQFAAGLKEVLVADTCVEAATVLDELGFAQVDTTVVKVPPSSEAAQQLGTAAFINGEEFPPHSIDNEGQQNVSPGDESENHKIGDTMPQSGITQGTTALDPEGQEETSASSGEKPGASGHCDDPERPTSRQGTGARRKSQTRARSEYVPYVAVRPDDEEETGPDRLTQQERMKLEEKSIKLILEEEPELKRMPTNNPGFDLILQGPDGQPAKWVEAKGMNATLDDHSVYLTRTQFEHAQKLGEAYWLYVVENAAVPEHSTIVRIQNPAGKTQRFTFNHIWKEVSEEDSSVVSKDLI